MKLTKNIIQIAKKVLQNEAEAVKNLLPFVDEEFERCVLAISGIKGRVVVTGIGKSALIASKMVATFNSTGTPAVFMHAADAIHGDLGMIQDQDIVICLSKSGLTPEIKVLVPLLKRRGVPIVALVGNIHSYLAEQADYVLNATIAEEACPHNLAPTTSTTAALALGDALAICLLELKEFSKENFAEFHPGGTLGKRMYLRVQDIFPRNTLPKVGVEASIREVIIEISGKRLGATCVVEGEKLAGIITDGDLRRMLNTYDSINGLKAADIMTKSPRTIEPDAYAVEALRIMQENNITQLVVIQNELPLGFIHVHDLLKEGIF
ncbi:MAG: KpsF/GutQ family sugar-phosphate isomerase [Cytophagaceae bacterium]|nr:KpsF/GutQ family sugar-phosphate isomerase [Cytophagaceae bacterium]